MSGIQTMAAWGQVLHDADLAEAILDRVLEHGRVIELRGPSYRTRHLRRELRAGRGRAAPRSQAEPSSDAQRDDARWPSFPEKVAQNFRNPQLHASIRSEPRPLLVNTGNKYRGRSKHEKGETMQDLKSAAKDPVCGMTVDTATALHAERDGKTSYFCSDGCRQKFLSGAAGGKPERKSGSCCG